MGNKSSNAIWNPNESLHPPPTALNADERDSEIEKYIRRKYEQGAFRKDTSSKSVPTRAPTSLNRARELDGRLPSGSVTGLGVLVSANRRNPELNDIVTRRAPAVPVERELPALPVGGTGAPPRPRPARSGSSTPAPIPPFSAISVPAPSQQGVNGANGIGGGLVNLNGGITATLPFQMNVSTYPQSTGTPFNPYPQHGYSAQQSYGSFPQTAPIPGQAAFSSSPTPSSSFQPSYAMSTSAPTSLSMFDPLHPASQQQPQSQFQPQNAYPNQFQQQQQQQPTHLSSQYNGNMSFSPGTGFLGGQQQQGFAQQPQYGFGQQQSQFTGQVPQMGQMYGQNTQAQWNGGMGQMGMGMNMGYNNGMR